MSRIIKTDGVAQERKRLIRAVVLALRELMAQTKPDSMTRDLAAFIVLALRQVSDNVDRTVGPWEKRGYWLKADRFRLDWDWTRFLGDEMAGYLRDDDWGGVAMVAAKIAGKLSDVEVPKRHRLGTPWVGAWEVFRSKK